MRKTLLLSSVILLLLASCTETTKKEIVIEKDSVVVINSSDHLEMATLWFQSSAEAAALYHQAFNLAKIRLDEKIKQSKKGDKKLAIITDLDETAVDNSPFQAKLIKENKQYSSKSWNAWVNEERAKAMPGAVEFYNYAVEQGVHVVYLSNRDHATLDVTIENMKKLGFPNCIPENYLLKKEKSDKTERRAVVTKDYEVLLYLGDNLLDFDEFFAKRDESDLGRNLVEENKASFGDKFIVFPNPMYGAWEKAVYKDSYKHSQEEKVKMRKSTLQE